MVFSNGMMFTNSSMKIGLPGEKDEMGKQRHRQNQKNLINSWHYM